MKNLLPPAVVHGWHAAFGKKREPIRFTGDYKSWAEAEKESTGYAAPEILEKTRAALLKVKAGGAAFERDSVTFATNQFDFPLLAGLLRAALANEGCLRVLDFGGALGSSYFQCRPYLSVVKELHWHVVDQPAQVACGREEFANRELQFYDGIEKSLHESQPNVLLLASVIQYLPDPYAFLEETLGKRIPFVIVERTAFTRAGRTRLTVQHVPEWIYRATYPAWFLSEPAFREIFAKNHYRLVCEYSAAEDLHPEGERAEFKGFQYSLTPQT